MFWVVVAVITPLLLLAVSIAWTHYYQDTIETESLVTLVTILGIFLCLCTLVLIPIDIYLVSCSTNPLTGLKHDWATPEYLGYISTTMTVLYNVNFALVVVVCCIVVPFAYFYFEEYEVDETRMQRVYLALRYTLFCMGITAGIFLASWWLFQPSQSLTGGGMERLLLHTVANLMLLGSIGMVYYTGFGFGSLPINLVHVKAISIQEVQENDLESLDILRSLERNRHYRDQLVSRYGGVEDEVRRHRRDSRLLLNLDRQERVLERRLSRHVHVQSWWRRVLESMWRPFEVVLGLVVGVLGVVVLAAILLSSLNSFVPGWKHTVRPVDALLTGLSMGMDYVLLASILALLFGASVHGIVRLDIRFLWIQLFRVHKGRTAPQAMLLVAVLLSLIMLSCLYTLSTSIAPMYTRYGSQVYCNYTIPIIGLRDCSHYPERIVSCGVDAPSTVCTPTHVSTLINDIVQGETVHATFYRFSQLAMVLFACVAVVWEGLCGCRPSNEEGLMERLQEENDERRRLLALSQE